MLNWGGIPILNGPESGRFGAGGMGCMLERPEIEDARLVAGLREGYGLTAVQIDFLPLGADVHTAVFRVLAGDGTPYFYKLRKGAFDETSVVLAKFLYDQGITQIIPPLVGQSGQLWETLDAYKTILYPFVDGQNGYEAALSVAQWEALGCALKRIHTAVVPAALTSRIRRETYGSQFRQSVRRFMAQVEDGVTGDAIARELAAFLKARRGVVLDLVAQAERLAEMLLARPLAMVVCHSDLHAGNILLGCRGDVYLVDWDEPILAPKERDLMYVGGGLMASGLAPYEEERLFYRGYGETEVQATAVTYYRMERIIQDIDAYCRELLLTDAGGEDRAQSLVYLQSNFLPGQTIDIAYGQWRIASLR